MRSLKNKTPKGGERMKVEKENSGSSTAGLFLMCGFFTYIAICFIQDRSRITEAESVKIAKVRTLFSPDSNTASVDGKQVCFNRAGVKHVVKFLDLEIVELDGKPVHEEIKIVPGPRPAQKPAE